MIKRLRPKYTEDQLNELYAVPHEHHLWEDHRVRVEQTIELGKELIGPGDTSGVDLSCGDGAIIRGLGLEREILGDFAPGYEFTGPLEGNVLLIPHVSVFVLCETLEHVDDPLWVLKAIRGKSDKLILSTPLNEATDENVEHYWAWDRMGIHELLSAAHWSPVLYRETPLKTGWYQFQIWGCE